MTLELFFRVHHGTLRIDENDMVVYLPVPDGAVKQGENKLTVDCPKSMLGVSLQTGSVSPGAMVQISMPGAGLTTPSPSGGWRARSWTGRRCSPVCARRATPSASSRT